MTNKEQLTTQIMEVLKSLDDSDMVYIWNEYCEAAHYYDNRIEDMDMLDEIFNGQDAICILQRAFYGHDQWSDESEFNPNRAWFMFNGYGNLISIDWVGYNSYAEKFGDCIDEDALLDYIIDNMDGLGNDEITDIINDYQNGID